MQSAASRLRGYLDGRWRVVLPADVARLALMKIELLYFEGCPSYGELLPTLRELLASEGVKDEVEVRRVETPEEAEFEHFLGSPTVRINGEDVDPAAGDRDDYGGVQALSDRGRSPPDAAKRVDPGRCCSGCRLIDPVARTAALGTSEGSDQGPLWRSASARLPARRPRFETMNGTQ